MVLLFFSPLIYLGLHLLAIIDLRYEKGREGDFLKLTVAGTLPIVFGGLSLIYIAAEPPLNWKAGLLLLMATLFYIKTGSDLIKLRKTGLAPIRLHLALTIWAISLAFYFVQFVL
ncbi:hypothetical protein [Phaeobacter sp. NW0010-22]|uniref:hypothetical protein n=1 Tax=Phaeobacter sp. NW0010-22 TaxID=3135907 RepID=UPI00333E62B1